MDGTVGIIVGRIIVLGGVMEGHLDAIVGPQVGMTVSTMTIIVGISNSWYSSKYDKWNGRHKAYNSRYARHNSEYNSAYDAVVDIIVRPMSILY